MDFVNYVYIEYCSSVWSAVRTFGDIYAWSYIWQATCKKVCRYIVNGSTGSTVHLLLVAGCYKFDCQGHGYSLALQT